MLCTVQVVWCDLSKCYVALYYCYVQIFCHDIVMLMLCSYVNVMLHCITVMHCSAVMLMLLYYVNVVLTYYNATQHAL